MSGTAAEFDTITWGRERRFLEDPENDAENDAEEEAGGELEIGEGERRIGRRKTEAELLAEKQKLLQRFPQRSEISPSYWSELTSRIYTTSKPRIPYLDLKSYQKMKSNLLRPVHQRQAQNIPHSCPPQNPEYWFDLLWTPDIFYMISENTNRYAERYYTAVEMEEDMQRIGFQTVQVLRTQSARPWKKTTPDEIAIWVGISIYMGLYRINQPTEYWSTKEFSPRYPPMQYMSQDRWMQIKRFLHISNSDQPVTYWFEKVTPLSDPILENSRRYLLPATQCLVDEMMFRFTGRSKDKTKAPHKPIPMGYELHALCERGYTLAVTYSSGTNKQPEVYQEPDLNPTTLIVFTLAKRLPYKDYIFHLYMDNKFTGVDLFSKLRRELGIGACGTARADRKLWPKQWKTVKSSPHPTLRALDFGGLMAKAVGPPGRENDVLAFVWVDSNIVQGLTTIHDFRELDYIVQERRRPTGISATQKYAKRAYGKNPRCLVVVTKACYDYNQFMGGVDIADQLRSYYNCQIIARRNWLPLFYGILDICVINAYLLAGTAIQNYPLSHWEFRYKLAESLIKRSHGNLHSLLPGMAPPSCIFQKRVTININGVRQLAPLPAVRLLRGKHISVSSSDGLQKRWDCFLCRRELEEKYGKNPPVSPRQTRFYCKMCEYPLCNTLPRDSSKWDHKRTCHERFHHPNLQ